MSALSLTVPPLASVMVWPTVIGASTTLTMVLVSPSKSMSLVSGLIVTGVLSVVPTVSFWAIRFACTLSALISNQESSKPSPMSATPRRMVLETPGLTVMVAPIVRVKPSIEVE